MSLEFMDGFDHYSNSTSMARKWDTGSSSFAFPAGRFGGLASNQDNSSATKTLTSVATRVVGFALFPFTSLAAATILSFLDSGTVQVDLRLAATGTLQVTRNGTVLATSSAGVVSAGVWQYIEFKAKIDPTTGTYEVRVGGVTVLSGSGANTRNTANSTTNQFKIATPSLTQLYFDDLYALNISGLVNSDFLGECRILTSFATGDGASSQWTPSTGTNHFAVIDETTPNDDTDYNSDANVGDIDLYTFPSVSPTGAIGAVQTTMCARKDDAGTRQLSEVCRSGGTNFVGGLTFTMLSTYLMYMQIRETDPNTSSAWTNSGVNNAQFGAKVIA